MFPHQCIVCRCVQVFVDMDGVLADFDGAYENTFGERPNHLPADWEADAQAKWDRISKVPRFFRNLPPMADEPMLWEFLAPMRPTILTGVPSSVSESGEEKRQWIAERYGLQVPVITCRSRDKYRYGWPGDILIDDREKCGKPWEKMGGIWIKHTSAADSIRQLRALRPT